MTKKFTRLIKLKLMIGKSTIRISALLKAMGFAIGVSDNVKQQSLNNLIYINY